MKFPVVAIVAAMLALNLQAENWPWFRGPSRQGVSSETNLPTQWSADSVKWKVEVPGEGWSSPIVWNDQVIVTTATENGTQCQVISYNRTDGKQLWKQFVVEQVPLRKEGKNSYATPTPATDGQSVFVVFGDGSMAALNLKDGKVLWTNRDVKFYSQHGLGASPILWQDLVIMPFDGSNQGEDKRVGWQKPWDKSFIVALDKKTGKQRWRAERGMSRIAHVTPNILKWDGKEQLVSGAGDVVQGFDLASGERVWSIFSQGEGVVPSIVIGDSLIYSASGFEKSTIRAIKPGGKGDVTSTHIAWEQTKGVPSMPSFVHQKPHLFSITQGGVAQCMNDATGEIIWQERVGGNHSASPVLADGKIFFLSEEGESAIIEAKPEFKLVARNNLSDRFQASMAISQGNIFIRGEKTLYCIGK